jgi:ectoine hydroxylase-related dioxygenase (phytanoyl-CoA dioxygenase family)
MMDNFLKNECLNEEQLLSFTTNGYLRLPNILPASLLQKLNVLFYELLNTENSTTYKVVHVNKGNKYVASVENVCNKGNLACLELLGYPTILKIAEQICGADFFMIQEFAVIKTLGDEVPVLWHQDMHNERKGNCFTMGIYLDDANEGDGALKIIPQSHLSKKDICEIIKEPSIEIPMQAGGILLHDMMLAHSSDPIKINNMRRVIYFEFLSATHVRAESIYTEDLIKRRTKLIFLAIYLYNKNNANEEQFVHNKENIIEINEENFGEILNEIYAEQIRARPSAYCFTIANPNALQIN